MRPLIGILGYIFPFFCVLRFFLRIAYFSAYCVFLLSFCYYSNPTRYFTVHRAGSQLKMSGRQKLGTCKTCKLAKIALSHSLTLDMLNNFCFHSLLKSHSLSHSLHSPTISLSQCLKLSLFQSLIQSLLTC